MSKYQNLPGFNIELLDGNLRLDEDIQGPIVLIIGAATSGPTSTPYLVQDTNVASNIYGSTSPLIEKMSAALQGGAKYVVLYRIGGGPSEVRDLFGADSLIASRDETVLSNTKYSVYIGPNPDGGSDTVLIVFNGEDIVYSNVPGAVEDNGEVIVSGFDDTFIHQVGTPGAPVALNQVISSLSADVNSTFPGDDVSDTFALPYAGVDAGTLVVDVAGEVQVDGVNYTMTDNAYPTNDEIVFTAVARTNVLLDGDNVATTFELPEANTVMQSVVVDSVTLADPADYSISAGTGAGGVDEIVFVVAPLSAVGNIAITYVLPVPATGDTVTVTGTALPTIPGATYSPGEDNIGCPWQKYYELLDEAYVELETTNADVVFVDRAILDTENIADGSVAVDRLSYFRKTESLGVVEYSWSDAKTLYQLGAGTTVDAVSADLDLNGQPIIAEQFNEVNFAHQFGTWAHNITENDRFVLGVIGTTEPVANTRYAVATWIGTLPQTDALGEIIANGSGLLGNKFMSGGVGIAPGFFATDSGFPDGRVLFDDGGAPKDLGKYFSVASSSVVTIDGQTNFAAIYSGLLSSIAPGESTTNRLINSIGLPFIVKKNKLDELSFAGYVTVANKTRGTAVVSGELPTSPDSDYQYISTPIIIKELVGQLRAVSEPYIGGGLSDITLAAMETAFEGVFEEAARGGWITKYKYSVVSTPQMRVRGQVLLQMTVVPVFELREINSSLKLAATL